MESGTVLNDLRKREGSKKKGAGLKDSKHEAV